MGLFKRLKKKKYSIPVQESIFTDDVGYTQLQKEHPQDGRLCRFKNCFKKKAKRIKEIFLCCTKDSSKEFVQEESSDTSAMEFCSGLECDTGENKHKTESPDNTTIPNAPVEETTALVHRNEAYTPVPCLVFDEMKIVTGWKSEFAREELPAMDLGIILKHLNRMKIVIRADETNPKTAAFDAEEVDTSKQDCDIATTAVYENCIDIKDDFQDGSEVNSRTSSYESLALASDETYVKMPSSSDEDDLYFEKLEHGDISRISLNENLTSDADETYVKLPINSVEDGLPFQEGVLMMPSSNWLNEHLTSDAEETVVKLYGNSDKNDLYNFEPKLTLSDTQEFQNLKAVNADDNILLNMSDDQQTVPKTTDSPSLYSTDEIMVTSTSVIYNGNQVQDAHGSSEEEQMVVKCVTSIGNDIKNKTFICYVPNSQSTSFPFNRNNLNREIQLVLKYRDENLMLNELKELTYLNISDRIHITELSVFPVQQESTDLPLPPNDAGQVNQNANALPTPVSIRQNQPANQARYIVRSQPLYENDVNRSNLQTRRVLTEERINADMETFCHSEALSHSTCLKFVKAGFVLTGHNNTVVCRECGARLLCTTDDPLTEHAVNFPYCSFIRAVYGVDYIDRLPPETAENEISRYLRKAFQTTEVQGCLEKFAADGTQAYPVARRALEQLRERGLNVQGEAGTLWKEMKQIKQDRTVYTDDLLWPVMPNRNPNTDEAARLPEREQQGLGQDDLLWPVMPDRNPNTDEEARLPEREEQDLGQGLSAFSMAGLLCFVCHNNKAQITYLTCGHKICCRECARDICQQCQERVVGQY